MNFLERIFENLRRAAGQPVLQEARADGAVSVTGAELLALTADSRAFIHAAGLARGDRCAIVAPNSIRWVALDLALMAEGIVTVPLYARQAPAELAAMLRDAQPSLICVGDAALSNALASAWPSGEHGEREISSSPAAPRRVLFDEIFARSAPTSAQATSPAPLAPGDVVTIIYTSGTSGEAKGVQLNRRNLDHMLGCTGSRLDLLMGHSQRADRVFHYLPFSFAGSWILLLSCLSRSSVLTLLTDLPRFADDLCAAEPDYLLNVPTILERIRRGIEDNLKKRGAMILRIYEGAAKEWLARTNGTGTRGGAFRLALARLAIFPAIRKRLGPNLRALICGSAPLASETQRFFEMLGIPVLQVYGLTETTGICTMDDPRRVEPGTVGPAVPGVEMKVGENQEILVRGPNIFPGYWNRPDETANVLRDGWFHSGDQGEVNEAGNWRIVGRIKNLIILNSGHNIAPEPIEEDLRLSIPGVAQVVLVGNGRGYLSVIIAGPIERRLAQMEVERINGSLPHYKQIRAIHVEPEAFTIESGLLTANGKLKRDAISTQYRAEIEAMYQKKAESAAV
ncbi:MAG: AMP-binding protein [Candidatus Acidiferrales bacterium]